MKKRSYTQEQLKVFRMLRRLSTYMHAHPHNEEHSQHADRLSDLEDVAEFWLPKMFKEMNLATGEWEPDWIDENLK